MRRIRLGSAAVAVCLALLVAACGGGNDALQGGNQPSSNSKVIVGSTNFPEQLILAQMYAAVLKKAGVDVTTRLNLGNREVVFPALEKGDIQLLPEYNGSVLSFLDPKATATTSQEVDTALAPLLQAKNLVALLSLLTELVLGRVQTLVVSKGLAQRSAEAAVGAKVQKAA